MVSWEFFRIRTDFWKFWTSSKKVFLKKLEFARDRSMGWIFYRKIQKWFWATISAIWFFTILRPKWRSGKFLIWARIFSEMSLLFQGGPTLLWQEGWMDFCLWSIFDRKKFVIKFSWKMKLKKFNSQVKIQQIFF